MEKSWPRYLYFKRCVGRWSLCFVTALSKRSYFSWWCLIFYGLVDWEPFVHCITIYSGYNPSALTNSGYKVYTVKKELLDLGKTTITNQFGHEIPMYDLERTICDLVRSGRNLEIQDFNMAIKTYLQRSDKDLNCLMVYAKAFRIEKIIRQYMEVLL